MISSSDPTIYNSSEALESNECLANVIWTSLTGAQAHLSQQSGSARRYLPEFAPFGAAPHYTARNIAEIAEMLSADELVALFTTDRPEVPAEYRVVRDAVVLQMVARRRFEPRDNLNVRRLTQADAPDMLKLIELTNPGPFNTRTNEMGTFIGIHDKGKLVAMAGERMIAGNYVEVSAVCTHPNWRGQGLAALLIEQLSAMIQQRGSIPFLHVFSDNAAAIRLYRQLGFHDVRCLHLTVLAKSPALN